VTAMTGADHPAAGAAVAAAPRKATAYAWYALAVMTLIWTFNQIDRRVVSILLEPIRQEFNLSDGQLGVLSGLAFGVSYAAAVIPLGVAVDRWNRRNLLAAMLLVWSGLTALGGFARSFSHLVAIRMVVGASEAACTPASLSMISDLFPRERRTMAVALFESANAIGAIICFVAGGYIAAQHGWRTAFLVAGLPGVVLAVLVLATFREPRRGQMEDEAGAPDAAAPAESPVAGTWRLIRSKPSLPLNMFATAFVSTGNVGIMGWIASFLIRTHGLDLKQAGLTVAMISGVCGGIGIVCSGLFTNRFARGDPGKILAVSAVFSFLALVFSVIGLLSPALTPALVALALFGLVCTNFIGLSYTALLNQSPPHLRGTVMGALGVLVNLFGYACGPVIVGLLSDAYGGPHSLRWAMVTITGLYALSGVLFLLAARAGKREAAEAAAR
jgi:predicted MFS family arabinose efflux permease